MEKFDYLLVTLVYEYNICEGQTEYIITSFGLIKVFFALMLHSMNLFVAHHTLCITGFNFETESLVVCVCI